jgi:hypothetical protein
MPSYGCKIKNHYYRLIKYKRDNAPSQLKNRIHIMPLTWTKSLSQVTLKGEEFYKLKAS